MPVGAVRRAALLDADGEPIDDVLVWLRGREPCWDVVVDLHGSPVLVDLCQELAEKSGFTTREPSAEDLWRPRNRFEAAGWTTLPKMRTEAGVRWLLGQIERLPAALRELCQQRDAARLRAQLCSIADRVVIARWFASPLRVAVAGPPNAGKSTLINAVCGRRVSLVSHVPGTTRDFLETLSEHAGWPVMWIDTAGLRRSDDALEAAGMEQTRRVLASADVIVCVLDVSADPPAIEPGVRTLIGGGPTVVVALNKTDLPHHAAAWRAALANVPASRICELSARLGHGLDRLVHAVLEAGGRTGADLTAPAAFTNELAERLRRCAASKSPHDELGRILDQG